MDNVTHSLIGLAIGEAVAVHRKKARLPIWIASAVANNLPDFDLIITSLVHRDRLGYLLHHRGHTHTLLAAPFLGMLLLLAMWLWGRKKPNWPWREIIFVSIAGSFFHLLADSWNSYGVHPFWPLDNGWFYGDMLFIVEPWLWAFILPAIFFACASRWGKGICLALLGLILGLAWYQPMVPWAGALAVTVGSVVSFLLQSKIAGAGKRISFALVSVSVFLLALFGLSQSLQKEYGKPGAELALHPFPANPLCWSAMRAELGPEEYRAEVFTVAPFPSVAPVSRCPALAESKTTAALVPSTERSSDSVSFLGEFRAPRAELVELSRDCHVNAFLRYARIPFWKKFNGGWILGDLRYDREEGLGFTEFFMAGAPADCPWGVPPWVGRFHPENLAR